MITTEQNKEISKYLISKNLPIDLVLEIKDHMMEQIENMEDLCFEEAFEKVKLSWKEELKMVYNYRIPSKKITVFHKRILNKIDLEILKKATLYFLPFMLISASLCVYNKEIAILLYLATYSVISIITVISMIVFYKYYKSSSQNEKRNISIYQRGSLAFFLSGIYVIIFNLMNLENRFEKVYHSLIAIYSMNFEYVSYLAIFYTYFFVFGWVCGLFYFINYRKTVSELKQIINLKL